MYSHFGKPSYIHVPFLYTCVLFIVDYFKICLFQCGKPKDTPTDWGLSLPFTVVLGMVYGIGLTK